jgi:aminopeptidase N
MRAQDDPRFVQPLLDNLSRREGAFSSWGYGQGLGAVAYLARNEQKKDQVRDFLMGQLNSKRRRVQIAAIDGLGTLGDATAIAVLDKFCTAGKESPQKAAAERAVASLRAARKPVDDFKNLRQEVLDLQKDNRQLRKDLEDVKKQLETQRPAPVTAEKQAPVAKPKAPSPKYK